jgi:aspartate dehydrogenase
MFWKSSERRCSLLSPLISASLDPRMKMGLIGAGAIGRQVLAALAPSPDVELVVLLRPGRERPAGWSPAVSTVNSLEALLALQPKIVVECAGREAAAALVPSVLQSGVSVVLCSISVLADPQVLAAFEQLAERNKAAIVIPGGAVAGIDYLRAVSRLAGTQVTYISRKPPQAWQNELASLGHSPEHLAAPVTLFEGPAADAARLFPRNLNVALTIALAAGSAHTTVRVIADPSATGNDHEIDVSGPAGSAHMRFINAPSPDNPKTSALTALSVLHAIDSLTQPHGLRFV